MVTAYLLLQAEVGSVKQTLDAVTADPGVAWAEPVTGPYDVIAAVEGNGWNSPASPAPSPVPPREADTPMSARATNFVTRQQTMAMLGFV